MTREVEEALREAGLGEASESWVVTDAFWQRVVRSDGARSCRPEPDGSGKKGANATCWWTAVGVPLSLIVTVANDGKRIDEVLAANMVQRKRSPHRRSKHLCADAGYRGAEYLRIIEAHGYIPHVVNRRKKTAIKRRGPNRKVKDWVVKVCHSGFNRLRKLRAGYEKLERSFAALHHLAATIIAFRKVPLKVNINYG